MDDESKKHLAGLGSLGLSSLITEITANEEDDQDDSRDSTITDDAVDYSDISEVAEDETNKYRQAMGSLQPSMQTDDEEDYDADCEDIDSKLMPPPPPPIVPTAAKKEEPASQSPTVGEEGDGIILPSIIAPSSNVDKVDFSSSSDSESETDRPCQGSGAGGPPDSLTLPLAGIMQKDAAKALPGSQSSSQSSGLEGCLGSYGSLVLERTCRQFGGVLAGRRSGSTETLSLGRLRQKESPQRQAPIKVWMDLRVCAASTTRAITMMAPVESKFSQTCGDGDKETEARPKVAEWRYGPAQLWYDMLDGSYFNYGFRLKEEQSNEHQEHDTLKKNKRLHIRREEDDNNENNGGDKDVSDLENELFLMVTQLKWEEDIIWNGRM
ncbi:hypothetical protein F7725_007095 [Dissostichus mawsoni]|uniref:TAFII-230 TBP-binding domain-containing protein n=1 Tax=Dissostichus mawsoni TaxID=36200 RepID=A0A7J5XWS6_DISMA|nr:hypothetical protein F7725_007095 [Dissostichus mawsoni]